VLPERNLEALLEKLKLADLVKKNNTPKLSQEN
jgi:hypothetical protein